jgi:hypothetical protein
VSGVTVRLMSDGELSRLEVLRDLDQKRLTTAAERQARFRATHANGAPRIRYRSPADRRSRAQRWHQAVAELFALQDDYRTWLNALPPNLEASATAEALRDL